MQLNNKKQLELLLYKLLNDILFLWVMVFSGLLIAESVVSGYFSAYLSFTKVILILFAILFLIVWLGKKNNITFEVNGGKNIFKSKMILFLLLVSLVLIVNSLRSLGLIETAISSFATFVIFLFFLKTFLFPSKK